MTPILRLRLLLAHPVTWLVSASFALALVYGLSQDALLNLAAPLWVGGLIKMSCIIVLAMLVILGHADRLVLWALLFGGAGDWFLAQHSTTTFASGALAFAIGHICYIRAFRRDGARLRDAIRQPWRLAAMAAVFVGAALGVWTLIPMKSAWFPGLSAYTTVLTLMVAMALALPAARWLAMTGAALFLISDGFVAAGVFYPQPDQPTLWFLRQFIGWMLYWAAQAALCVGMLNLNRATAKA